MLMNAVKVILKVILDYCELRKKGTLSRIGCAGYRGFASSGRSEFM